MVSLRAENEYLLLENSMLRSEIDAISRISTANELLMEYNALLVSILFENDAEQLGVLRAILDSSI